MNAEREIDLLRQCIAEGEQVINRSADLNLWQSKSRLTLARIYGEGHSLLKQFDSIEYRATAYTRRTSANAHVQARARGVRKAMALLESAIYEREQLANAPAAHGDSIDPELWSHVSHLVDNGPWWQLASVSATFVEDKVREWSGLSPNEHSKDLMVRAFKEDGGKLTSGKTSGEKLGWQQLATGFVQALSNVDRHRIQKRDDAKTYAMGVLGAASLIITQLRHEHSIPIDLDTSPAVIVSEAR